MQNNPRLTLKLPDWRQSEAVKQLADQLGIHLPTAALLRSRGCHTAEDARRFLASEQLVFHDAFLMKDMDKAVTRIRHALQAGERITIYGDYDVDGVSAVSCLYLYLKAEHADVDYYIPERFAEGYGVNFAALERIAEGGTRLVITVDTGITAVEEAEQIAALGMDLVVTDHHACPDILPNAVAVVDPHRPDCPYPFKELAGVGVVFKLLSALEQRKLEEAGERSDAFLRNICLTYLDLVTLGTVADVVSLTDENRLIVTLGLKQLSEGKREGVRALLTAADATRATDPGKPVTAATVSFLLAPRINAAGRISNAKVGVELFLADTPFHADELAHALCEQNRLRKAEEDAIWHQALSRIKETHDFTEEPVLVLSGEGWHPGVIGIVASRITEQFHCPTVMITTEGKTGKGSARSVPGLNLVDAFRECTDLLVRFGGHAQAAGLTVETDQIDAFRQRINAFAREAFREAGNERVLEADLDLTLEELSIPQIDELSLLEPCGEGNRQPLFFLDALRVLDITAIGGGKHTRMTLTQGETTMTALWFGQPRAALTVEAGDTVSVLAYAENNVFRGVKSAQLRIKELFLLVSAKETREEQQYRRLTGVLPLDPREVPTRAEFGLVYTALRALLGTGSGALSLALLTERCQPLSEATVRVMLDIFEELSLLSRSALQGSTAHAWRMQLLPKTEKCALTDSHLYSEMQRRAGG